MTDAAADAAIEQGCRILRLPTIREHHARVAEAAARQKAGREPGRRAKLPADNRHLGREDSGRTSCQEVNSTCGSVVIGNSWLYADSAQCVPTRETVSISRYETVNSLG